MMILLSDVRMFGGNAENVIMIIVSEAAHFRHSQIMTDWKRE